MRPIWTGIIVFILWAIFSNYWYVCKIKNLCSEEEISISETQDSYNIPDTSNIAADTGVEAEKVAALIESIEQKVIYFAFDSSFVLNDPVLQELTQEVNTLSPDLLLLEGHCCNIGSDQYNMALGKRRAERVKQALISQGVSAVNINTVSYGEERPALPNTSEENREKNRRVEILIKEK